jgi:TolB-like protein
MDRIAHYNLLERIGRGGLGEVYRARDTKLGRTVAIKVLPPELASDPARREDLLRDARAAAALSHPNIAALFEVGEAHGRLYLVFEYVPGQTLHAIVGGRPMNPRRALDLAIQLADAVAEAHAAGIVHRDLKPENVLVTPKGHAKILDFGLAAWTRGGAARRAAAAGVETAPGVGLGTLAYMSPEQARGEAIDERSDIFSLGVVIFEMLTGRNPFVGASGGSSTVTRILRDAAPAPSSVNRELPPELDAILARALAKDPRERYQAAVTLAAELRAVAAILDVRAATASGTAVPTVSRPRGRGRRLALAAVLVLVAGGTWAAREPVRHAWRRYVGPPPPPVLAVLPFEVADPSWTYLADGLADDLITRLGQTPGLRVLGRSATRESRGATPAKLAAAVRAAVVLTGSVQREGETLRVHVALVDAADGVQIWRRQFERPVASVLAVQADIAEAVARALRVQLAPTAARARTVARLVDPRAYDLYLKARDLAARRDRAGAAKLFEAAVAIDPALAEAHAGLALARYLDGVAGGDPFAPEFLPGVRQATREALSIDPDLPEARLAEALSAETLAEALAAFRRAIDLDASYAEAYHQLADAIVSIDPGRAETLYRRTLELDARLEVAWPDLALLGVLTGDRARLEADLRRALAANPGSVYARAAEALGALAAGRGAPMADVFREFAAGQDPAALPGGWAAYAASLYAAGRPAEGAAAFERLAARAPGFCGGRAGMVGVFADRGERAAAERLAAAIFADAEREGAPAPLARCAATAAAALGDASLASSWLRRIAAREASLRWWGASIMGVTGDAAVRLRLYPWHKVAEAAPVKAALADIQRAYRALRPLVSDALAGP